MGTKYLHQNRWSQCQIEIFPYDAPTYWTVIEDTLSYPKLLHSQTVAATAQFVGCEMLTWNQANQVQLINPEVCHYIRGCQPGVGGNLSYWFVYIYTYLISEQNRMNGNGLANLVIALPYPSTIQMSISNSATEL